MSEKTCRIGVDLGGTNIQAGVVDADNHLLAKANIKTNAGRPAQEIIRDIAQASRRALEKCGKTLDDCLYLGVGSPGSIDGERGVVLYAANLQWTNVDVLPQLKQYFDLPMYLSNDANCAALGEVKAGAAMGCNSAVLLTLGTGVGGGVVLDGRLLDRGPGSVELGHTSLVEGGVPCTCGRKGCLESYASATALARQAREAAQAHPESALNEMCEGDLSRMNGLIPFEAMRAGDPTAAAVVDQYEHYLAAGIANMVNIFRPEVVLLSGGISGEKENLTRPLTAMVAAMSFGGEGTVVPEIRTATLGNDAGIVGAANLGE